MEIEQLIAHPMKREAMYKADLLSFMQRAFEEIEPGQKLQMAPYLEVLCRYLDDIARGKTRRLIINIPPRHLKSLVTSVTWVAWLLARKPDIKIAVLSHNDDLSSKLAVKIKRLIQCAWYQALAPNVRIAGDRNRAQDFETTAGGDILFASVEAGITGRGFDILILDDPQSAIQALSSGERQRLHDLFTQSISSRLNRPAQGAILVVQQRLHVDDLSGFLLKRGGWRHLCLPLQATEQVAYKTYSADWVRPVGDLLLPNQYPPTSISEWRASLGARTFETQYQQAPISIIGEIILSEDLREVDAFPYDPKKTYTLSIDTALKTTPSSDYTAFVVIATDSCSHYVVDVVRTRVDLVEMRAITLELCARHGIQRVLIEDSANGPGLKTLLREKQCNAETVGVGSRDKVARLEDCRLFFSTGRVCIFRDMPWTRNFIEELLRFPHDSYDDQVDALSLYLNYVKRLIDRFPAAPYLTSIATTSLEPTYQRGRGKHMGEHPMRPRSGTPRSPRRW